jgi:hypothetical protein
MPKTGTSSIQETLYYHLEDPGFVYCGFGEINGSYALAALVGQASYFAALRAAGAHGYRQRMLKRLRRSIGIARKRGADLILSAEFAYFWGQDAHRAFAAIVEEYRLDLRLIIYVRPPLDWLASSLAQNLKFGQFTSHDQLQGYLDKPLRRQLDLAKRLALLVDCYGEDRLIIRPFLRHQLAGGCVVRDFCSVVGLSQPPATIYRRNEGLSLVASQCLHRRNIAMRQPLRGGGWDLLRRDALLQRLEQLFGDQPGLRLQPALLGDAESFLQQQLASLQQRHGVALPLSTASSAEAGLASLDALLSLPEAARRRLVAAAAMGEDATPEQALARLERVPSAGAVLSTARQLGRRQLRHALTGC